MPEVDDMCLCVANISEMRALWIMSVIFMKSGRLVRQLQIFDYSSDLLDVAGGTGGRDSTRSLGQYALGQFVVWV